MHPTQSVTYLLTNCIFKLWGDALRVAQLQLHHKRLRKLQEEAARERDSAVAARKEKKKKKRKKGKPTIIV